MDSMEEKSTSAPEAASKKDLQEHPHIKKVMSLESLVFFIIVAALFGLLGTGGIDKALDIFHPRNIRTYIKTLGNDPETRQILSAEFQNLMEAAKRTRMQPGDAKTLPEGK